MTRYAHVDSFLNTGTFGGYYHYEIMSALVCLAYYKIIHVTQLRSENDIGIFGIELCSRNKCAFVAEICACATR